MFAHLAFNLPTERIFTYHVPPEIAHRVTIGMRAFVPFGKVKKTGTIVGLDDQAPPAPAKTIIDLIDPEPLFDETNLRFYRWVADYYVTPLGKVLGEILPGAGKRSIKFVRFLPEALAAYHDPLSPLEERVIDVLRSSPQDHSVSTLRHTLGRRDVEPMLHNLLEKGLITVTERVGGKIVTEKRDTIISLAPDLPREKWGPAQKKVIATLERTGALSMAQLIMLAGVERSVIERLVKKGAVVKETVPVLRELPALPVIEPTTVTVNLSPEQQTAIERISQALRTAGFSSFLLHGVTGSGKTEVYLRVIEEVLRRGGEVLYLVPEIALTPQLLGRLQARFPDERVAVLHSGIPDHIRYDEWRAIRRGNIRLVCGARSAVFAPLRNLRLIVVDEEHDESYKQDEKTPYNARDLALVRGWMTEATVILGSATPSIQTYYLTQQGRRHILLSLPHRVEQRPLPSVEIVDMRLVAEGDEIISPRLRMAIGEALDHKKQVMLFLNRRGFHTFLICKSCGYGVKCPNCDLGLTLHSGPQRLICHYCDYSCPPLTTCPRCGERHVVGYGIGTERVEELLTQYFSQARISRMDRDAAAKPGTRSEILQALSHGDVDILVGTQMISKGHDFPGIALIGVISADTALHLPDFRAGERTFQLLTQMAGRGGRGDTPGHVIIQTFNPEHYVMKHVQNHDYPAFYEQEIPQRQILRYPPFSRLICIRISSLKKEQGWQAARSIREHLLAPTAEGKGEVLGPAPAPLGRLRGRYRWQIIVKAKNIAAQHATAWSAKSYRPPNGVTVKIDVDPLNFM